MRFRHATHGLCAAVTLLASYSTACAEFLDTFKDPKDGKFDASEFLLDRKGFLPVPIIITEPAVGYGGGLAVAFFRESLRESATRGRGAGRTPAPPDIFTVGGFGTENGTKGGFIGATKSFANDYWRYAGGVMRVDANLDFYGVGGQLAGADKSIGYNLDGWASVQKLRRRLGESNAWISGRWNYFDLSSRFDLGPNATLLNNKEFATRSSGLGLSLEYDSRDNTFTPSKGTEASLDTTFYDPNWGSATHFQAYRGHVFNYWSLGEKFVLGGRIDGRSASGDVPFYQLPFVDLRGVPMGRMQDEYVGVVEAELRWNVTPRWALLGFLGAGRTWGRNTNFSDGESVTNRGAGVRYLIASRLGLYAGLDLAWSTVDQAFYIQIGSAWR